MTARPEGGRRAVFVLSAPNLTGSRNAAIAVDVLALRPSVAIETQLARILEG